MSEQLEEPADLKCYLVTLEVDYEHPEIIKGFGCHADAEAFRGGLEDYQRSRPAWPDDGAPPDEWIRAEKAREAWMDAHPAGRAAIGADRYGIISAPFVPPVRELVGILPMDTAPLPDTQAPDSRVVDLPRFDGYQAHIVRELQAAFLQACDKAGIKVAESF